MGSTKYIRNEFGFLSVLIATVKCVESFSQVGSMNFTLVFSVNYLENKGGELVSHIEHKVVAASFATGRDDPLLGADFQNRLRVVAILAQHKP